ncbi:hypothetical protein SARC_11946 [Sphaeroforma arctica JP610]|uniref:Uncharacterized protein n=1 Tax=Sphaeroforma arctica JP610 TaxID=667725 RepID=A0A0L0FFH4_9EUKA|nr:hypothetical protein SARC_11946 [Sphaeroforma arctica JP610]KNC75532.1 hypothetical protein SARC_11946 [Sphaeroforma arctica JP610]|eukprot:XP_014149434.1 hypothetical protein SARC_11946 [Sphaeroforma arctica JP610]
MAYFQWHDKGGNLHKSFCEKEAKENVVYDSRLDFSDSNRGDKKKIFPDTEHQCIMAQKSTN